MLGTPREPAVHQRSRARACSRLWRSRDFQLILKLAVTLTALGILLRAIPWHDRVVLENGERARVVQRLSEGWIVLPSGEPKAAPRTVPSASAQRFEAGVFSLLANARGQWLCLYPACAGGLAVLLIARWGWLLVGITEPPTRRWRTVIWARSQVIAALPLSQVGGDLYRIERMTRYLQSPTIAVGVVGTERIMGLVGLLAAAVVGGALYTARSPGCETGVLITIAVLTVTVGGVVVMFSRRPRRSFGPAVARSKWLALLVTALMPLRELIHQPRRLLAVLALSAGAHFLNALSFAVVDSALGFDTPAWCYLVAVPALVLAQYLPIHIAGIGLLEGGLWLFLSAWAGRTGAEVLAVCAAARLLSLLWLGCLATAFLWPLPQSASPAPVHPLAEPMPL